jgi:hypothetical protein
VSDTANPNPDWYPDPTGRYEQRYWDGSQWTEHVSSAGQQRSDPLPGAEPAGAAAGDLPGMGDLAAQTAGPDTAAAEPAEADDTAAAEPAEAASYPSGGPGDPGTVAAPAVDPVVGSAPGSAGPAPDWYPDPTGRHEQRYWDGSQWTEHTVTAGQQGVDPLPSDDASGTGGATTVGAAATDLTGPGTAEEPGPTPEPVNPFAAAAPATGPAVDEPSTAPAGGPAADWYPDPMGRHELRYWDGSQWTEHVTDAGVPATDPVDQA